MATIPGGIDTESQPPMTVPLRHFVVAFGFLFLGAAAGFGVLSGTLAGLGGLAHVHLLLAGWVCITIMGAMTQFVPVWSGTSIHSRRLANFQLLLVVVGLLGFAGALGLGRAGWLAPFGLVMLVGFWTFAYNIARTLASLETLDVTERHFALALAFFVLLTPAGVVLATDLRYPLLSSLPVERGQLVGAHATLAVFGAILTTVYGALYQLGTMFTQTELRGVDHHLQTVQSVGHPVGVALLAGGRLGGWSLPSAAGGVALVLAALSFSVVLARKLVEMRVERTPMHTRYAVVPLALASWAVLTGPAWLADPLATAHRFGGPGSVHLLLLGAVGFVVFGTVYHIVPFIVWVHRYSDLLGFEDVPMIDDLYDDRLAAVDFALLLAGTALLVATDLLGLSSPAGTAGGVLVGLGILAFAGNVLLVLRAHSPHSLGRIVLGSVGPWTDAAESDAESPTPER